MLVIGEGGCIWPSMVVFGQKFLFLGKTGCNRPKWLYSGKVVLIGQNLLYSC